MFNASSGMGLYQIQNLLELGDWLDPTGVLDYINTAIDLSQGDYLYATLRQVSGLTLLKASKSGRTTTDFLSDVTVKSHGKVVGRGTVDLRGTIGEIKSGQLKPRDVFQNREGLLPKKPEGYYKEFVHPTPGVKGAGSQRIVQGQGGELYYTPDHYGSFVPLN